MLVKPELKQSQVSELPRHDRAADMPPRPQSLLRVGVRRGAQALLPIALLAGAYFGYQTIVANRAQVPSRPQQEKIFAVTTVPVAIATHQPTLKLYGEVVAGRRVDMRALVAGQVERVGPAMREGGIVAQGDILVEIDQFDYEGAVREARANLAEGRAKLTEMNARIAAERSAAGRLQEQVDIAQRDFARATDLRKGGALSEKAVDDRKLTVLQRQEALEQRQSNLAIEEARAEQQRAAIDRLEWKLTQAERNLRDTVLKAPFDAYVQNVNAQAGRLLGVNDVVATLIDRHALDVRFALSDAQFGRLLRDSEKLVGRPVLVRWVLGGEAIELPARIERTTAEIAAQRGGVDVFARLEAGDNTPLRPGAFVDVELLDRAYQDVARLPEAALYDGNSVYVVKDKRLQMRKVELAGYDGDHVLVRGDLTDGERVNTTRIVEIGEGLLVEERR